MTVAPTSTERREAAPLQTRLAEAGTVNVEARTVDVVWTTGAPVRRRRWDTGAGYDEILVVTPDAVDLSRLGPGAPVLDSHARYSMAAQLAVVERAAIENGRGIATVRFPSKGIDPEIDKFFALVQDGQRRNLSVGYSIDKVRVERGEKEGDAEKWFVERWTPMEISFVTIGADAGATVRSGEDAPERTFPVTFAAPAAPPAEAERARVADLTRVAGEVDIDLPPEFMARHIAAGTDVATFKLAVWELMVQRSEEVTIRSQVEVGRSGDDPASRDEAIRNALLHRVGTPGVELTPQGREYRGRSLPAIMREMLDVAGVSTRGMSDIDVVMRSFTTRGFAPHSTSDFPILLTAVLNTTLKASMEAAESGIAQVVADGTANDFRAQNEVEGGQFPVLDPVGESGELKHGTVGEGKEAITLGSFGKTFGVTFQVLANDNLDVIARTVSQGPARAAAELKTRVCLAALGANLADGNPIFHASRGNLAGSGAVLDVDAVGAGRLAMRKQKALGAVEPMGIGPSVLLVPPELETKGEVFLTQLAAATSAAVNPFAGRLRLAVESRLTDPTAWFLFADPAVSPVIRFLTLIGFETPKVEVKEEFDRLGTSWRITWHCGAGPIDFRGAYKNPGAAPG